MNERTSFQIEMEKLDRIPIQSVTIEDILIKISEQEHLQNVKMKHDISIFIVAAIMLLTGFIFALLKIVVLVIVLQVVVVVFLPILAYFDKKNSKQMNGWDGR
ncbi:DUF5345 family protein [Ectobacillus sp. sgz5001026]|uniref:DUF5345 family protein n=1 Tax=Ectobacillus sp. sgz5001026 TaxID=3242473 RepID=UPI0036D21178